MIQFELNGTPLYFDDEASKRHVLFIEYREKLLDLVGIGASDALIKSANKYLYDNYAQYRDFIDL